MKKIFIFLLMVAALATVSQAVVIDSFVNADFDSGAVTTGGPGFKGFDAPDATEIDGWANYPAGSLNDAGVEGPGAWWGPYETNSAFMSVGDAAYNMSSYVIEAGDVFNVSFFGKSWDNNSQWTVTLFYDNPANVIGSFTATLNGTWTPLSNATPIVATAPSVGGTLGILFENTGTGFSNLDEVTVVTVPLGYDSPANGATLISAVRTNADNDLVFTVYDTNITKVDVQFGTENDPNLTTTSAYKIVDDLAVTSWDQYTVNLQSLAADLLYEKTYYWKVIGYEPNAIPGGNDIAVPGPVWSFTTVPPTPVFTVNPGNSGAFPDGSAVLTAICSAVSPLTGSIQWFKVGTPDTEITTADPDVTIEESIVGQLTTSTLTINNMTLARDGQYYAKATNPGGTAISTNGALIIKRLLAQYLFESNLNDTSGSGLNGTNQAPSGAALTPAYAASVNAGMGQSLTFNGLSNSNPTNTTGNYVDLPDGFANFSQGITIAAWAYPTATNNWARIVQCGNGTNGGNNSFYFTRVGTGSTLRFENDNTNPTSATSITTGNNGITNNEWQFLVITVNTSETNNAVIYRNGIVAATGTITLPNVITRTNCFIGRSEWYGDALYKGQMDDVRIYNYGLTTDDVALLYSTVNGPFCQTSPIYDFSDDCKENLDDLLMLVTEWLDCGMYPSSACN